MNWSITFKKTAVPMVSRSSPANQPTAASRPTATSQPTYDEIVNFTQCLMENSAYPENLPEYVEDYLYEKRTNELMGDAVINA